MERSLARRSLPGPAGESKPILDKFTLWLEAQRVRVLPKGLLGTAITYCLNQWEKLNVFLQDGRLEIDNNRSERSIKPVVIGRNYVLNPVMC
jgi:transposase